MKHLQTLILAASCTLSAALTSCVHEFPEFSERVTVNLMVSHDLSWTEYDHVINDKTRAEATHRARYIIYAYPEGSTGAPAHKFSFYRDDISLKDFTTSISLPAGRWDLYAWQDLEAADGLCYYDVTDFSRTTHTEPYKGGDENREAFEGHITIDVPESYEAEMSVSGELHMERPMGKYVFIATDFDKFLNEKVANAKKISDSEWATLSPDQKVQALKGYSIVAMYPFYMPYVYNQFTHRITDSKTGISYEYGLRPLSKDEAEMASDHVFMNHHESGAQVQLALRTPKGELLKLTDVITVPMRRGQITYVRGNFLTAGMGSGLEIDFEFSGDINIKVP